MSSSVCFVPWLSFSLMMRNNKLKDMRTHTRSRAERYKRPARVREGRYADGCGGCNSQRMTSKASCMDIGYVAVAFFVFFVFLKRGFIP